MVRVFILEDEGLILLMLEEMVRELGYAVWKTASSLKAAREALSVQVPDVALLDANVNGELTFEIAHLFKQRGVPIVFVTGYDTQLFEETDWKYAVAGAETCDYRGAQARPCARTGRRFPNRR